MDKIAPILEIQRRLSKFEYGVPINGKIKKTSEIDFGKEYKTLTAREFEKYEAGVCWDFANYQEIELSKIYGNSAVQNYYFIVDKAPNYPTHTITTVKIGEYFYYPEASWGKMMGVYRSKNISHILSTVAKNLADEAKGADFVECRKYSGYDRLSKLSPNEYMDRMNSYSKVSVVLKEYDLERINKSSNNESYIEESVKTRNQIGETEVEDIKTVISSLNDNSFSDFKFKDIVYCDIRYKSKKPIAFITIRTKLINNSTVGYVSLAVDPKYQNQGVGKCLTEKAVSWFKKERGIHFLEWHCLQNNEASKKLANSFGFREYIAKNEDEYIHYTMESSVNESYTLEFKKSEIEGKSIVYFTKEITPQSLLKIYQFMTNPSHGVNPLHGNIGVKISTGEYGSHNFLSPLLIKDLVSYLHGVIVECNTAYVGKRNTTEDHWKTIKAHGFLNIANCDIMDEEGDFPLPVKDPYHIEKNYVGDHLKRYDSILMLSHFKGHAMAGYGGALKNMSIGMASSRGKLHIHTAGEGGDMMKADRDKFLESMVDADMSVMDYMGKENILYINVANNLSIDCDCDAHPKDPYISDIGIFASTDPVALDQACIDAVYNHPEEKKRNLINRITSRNGTHTIDCAYEKGLGNKHYVILDIDQVVEESTMLHKVSSNESLIEEEIENEFSPTSFVKRSSLPAKNQKNHARYLRKKAHSNKTNNATTQNELPKYNQIGELYVEEVAKSVQIKPIFIVTSYTNTPFGKAIKTFTHSEYTHAAISFDTSLEKLYSFNADSKYSNNGYKGGISRESLSSYIDSYEKTIIQVNCIFLKPSDFDIVQRTLGNLLENEEKTKYAYSNIINILIGRAKDTGMAMVCSQFVAYILHTANIELLDKSDNIVTPKDLSTITNPKVYKIFEGYAKDYEKKRIDRIFRKLKTKALLIKESLLKLCV